MVDLNICMCIYEPKSAFLSDQYCKSDQNVLL